MGAADGSAGCRRAVCCVRDECCVIVREREREEGLTPVMQIHSCAVSSEGGVKCWGRSDAGQVMIHFFMNVASCNSASDVDSEQPVMSLTGFLSAAGRWHIHQPVDACSSRWVEQRHCISRFRRSKWRV